MAKDEIGMTYEGEMRDSTSDYRPNADENGESCTSLVLSSNVIGQPRERYSGDVDKSSGAAHTKR